MASFSTLLITILFAAGFTQAARIPVLPARLEVRAAAQCTSDKCYNLFDGLSEYLPTFCPRWNAGFTLNIDRSFSTACSGNVVSRISSACSCLYGRGAVQVTTTASFGSSTTATSIATPLSHSASGVASTSTSPSLSASIGTIKSAPSASTSAPTSGSVVYLTTIQYITVSAPAQTSISISTKYNVSTLTLPK